MKWEPVFELPDITSDRYLFIIYGTNTLADSLKLENVLTSNELVYAERLKGNGQKNTWLSCRATLRLIMGKYLNMNPAGIELKKGRFGKLHIAKTHLFFNVSHSDHSFLLGFNPSGRIGVDIENLSGHEDLISLIDYAFSDEEAIYCRDGEVSKRFTEIWTSKEAFLKTVGVGLVDNLKLITVCGAINNHILNLKLNRKTFQCPDGETASIVFRNNLPVKFFRLG